MIHIKSGLRGSRASLFLCVGACMIFLAGSPACRRDQTQGRVFVSGLMTPAECQLFLLEQKDYELITLDSVVPDTAGRFGFIIYPAGSGIYAVRFPEGQQVVFIAAPGDTIRIRRNLSGARSVPVAEGNTETGLLQAFYDHAQSNLRKVDSLQAIVDRSQGADDFYACTLRIDSLLGRIWEDQRLFGKAFIRDHAGTLASLLAVQYHFGIKPVLSLQNDRQDYLRVDSGLMANYPGNRHTLLFHRWLQEIP